MTIKEMRKYKMRTALNHYATISDAARALGVNKRTLYRFIKNNLKNDGTI